MVETGVPQRLAQPRDAAEGDVLICTNALPHAAAQLVEAFPGRRTRLSRSLAETRRRLRRTRLQLVVLADPLDVPRAAAVHSIRAATDAPLLVVIGDDAPKARAEALLAGADAVVSLPVAAVELAARADALLRRSSPDREGATTAHVGLCEIDLEAQAMCWDGAPVPLTPLEFRLVALLCGRPGHTFTRRAILSALWQSDHVGNERVCDTYVSRIRRKLERDPARPRALVTVRGVGYKCAAWPEARSPDLSK